MASLKQSDGDREDGSDDDVCDGQPRTEYRAMASYDSDSDSDSDLDTNEDINADGNAYGHATSSTAGPTDLRITDDNACDNDAPPSLTQDASALAEAAEAADSLLSASRSYQLEMFEESLRRNIIVVMDTGTGKTRIAILRIRAELERSPSKTVWFLAPNVILCNQQFAAISSQIPGFQCKILTGDSNMETWSTFATWNAILHNVNVMVVTPGVLLEALKHAFVTMASISLLVFDEAHGCIKQSPGASIMRLYNACVAIDRPFILGLTASPVHGRKIEGLEKLEEVLHATCVTPKRHRSELAAHTNRPQVFGHVCEPADASLEYGGNLKRLQRVADHADLVHDDGEDDDDAAARKTRMYYKRLLPTSDYDEVRGFLRSFCRYSDVVFQQLGRWAAEYYVYKIVRKRTKATKPSNGPKEVYLVALLQQVRAVRPPWPSRAENEAVFLQGLSSKVRQLAAILQAYDGEDKGQSQRQRPTGIVFVKERPMAAVLARLISLHPATRARFQVGHVVGMAYKSYDLKNHLSLSPKNVLETLRKFRAHTLNLIVTTSVMEEGIDIPACNLVVCIDRLTSLKSFIQRRGRARETNSEFHLLVGANDQRSLQEWGHLERVIKELYDDESREASHTPEADVADPPDKYLPPIRVPATGACLQAKDTKAHLQHFCAKLSSAVFADAHPVYHVHDAAVEQRGFGLVYASVQLPIILPAHLRLVSGKYAWAREEDAFIDAAYQAYKKIHEAGLLTDHLLPPQPSDDILKRSVEGRPGVVTVYDQYRPWPAIQRQWKHLAAAAPGSEMCVYRHVLRITNAQGAELFEADLILPRALPPMAPFELFWTAHSERPWIVHVSPARAQQCGPEPDQYHDEDDAHDHASVLLHAAFGHRWPLGDGHCLVRVLFVDEPLSKAQVAARPFATQLFAEDGMPTSPDTTFLVRDAQGVPFIYQEFLKSKPPSHLVRKAYNGFLEAPDDAAYVVGHSWPKIVGFLHKTANVQALCQAPAIDPASGQVVLPVKPYPHVLPAVGCMVDSLPMSYVQFGALLPSLFPVLEVYLVAAELLASTRLHELKIHNMTLVATAISAPAARLPTDYEYLEFIGDSVLKLCATVNCAAQNLQAPEGYLSLYKDRLVANSRLCRAALELGLDRYIVREQGSLRKWQRYFGQLDTTATAGSDCKDAEAQGTAQPPRLQMSTKMLADVVEALIGACHTEGGLSKALECMSIFEPDALWLSVEECRERLVDAAPETVSWSPPPALEQLLDYSFTKKALLLEALTHASAPNEHDVGCMERLEFIGDAILDHVIVQTLADVRPTLPHQKMHLLRTVVGNAGFLGFVTMECAITETASTMVGNDPWSLRESTINRALWTFMRHGALWEMARAQQAAAVRFAELRNGILAALWGGRVYPWSLLLQLRADKFYSDLLEALIGAVWVDSGSLAAVEALLDRLGILPYLRRAVTDDVHLMHPKEELGIITGNAKIRYDVATSDAPRGDGNGGDDGGADVEKGPGHSVVDDGEDTDDEELSMAGDENGPANVGVLVYDTDHVVLHTCRLFINRQCIVTIDDARSREEAETRAAEYAVEAWKRGEVQ